MSKFNIGPKWKTAIGIVTAIGIGVAATFEALADQKKEQEFETMKKQLAELQNK